MNSPADSIKVFFKRLTQSKYFKSYVISAAVILVGVVLIIITPWQTYTPDEDFSTPTPTLEPGQTPDPDSTPDPALSPAPEDPPEPTPTPIPGEYNPLTGEPWAGNKDERPWAISINNYRDSLPQQGIAPADIIYEFVTEGGHSTRMLALYQDASDVGIIGSVRSAREYIVEIAEGHDALFVHASGRLYDDAIELNGNPVTRRGTLDVNGKWVGRRDSYRRNTLKMQLDATMVVDGVGLTERISEINIRRDHEDYEQTLRFKEDGTPENGLIAKSIEVKFTTNSKSTFFSYSDTSNRYTVRQYSRDLIDTVGENETDIILSFTNVLVLQTDIQLGVNDAGHSRVRTEGQGTGFYFNGGRYIEITWSREANKGYVYKLTNGEPLELGIGKTYICIVSTSQTPIVT